MQPDTQPPDLTSSTPDPRRSRGRALGLFATVAVAAYGLDLGTKVLAVAELEDRAPVQVVGELLQLTLVRNPGAAFSTGTSYTLVLSLIAVAAAVVVLYVARTLSDRLWAIGLGCLLGGVLGNLTDRLFRAPGPLRGHVIDWIQLPNWPVFNVADMCIDAAAVVIVVQALRGISPNGDRERSEPGEHRQDRRPGGRWGRRRPAGS
jgi:signal peptidase II